MSSRDTPPISAVQPVRPDRPGFVTRVTRSAARIGIPFTRPLAGRRWFRFWGVVHHVGRTSGRRYAVPVVVRPTHDGFVVPLPWGGETQWARNVLAAGGAVIRWDGRDIEVTDPVVLPVTEVPDAFSRIQRAAMGGARIRAALRVRRLD
jgi:hypothetical protein